MIASIRYLSCAFFLFLCACSPQDHQASGTLERDRITLLATASEIIIETPVSEGSKVEKGQVLLKLDPQNQQWILDKAQAQLEQAQANLDKALNGARIEDMDAAKAQLASAKARLTDAQKQYNRIYQLVEKGVVTRSERDSALASRNMAQADYDAAYQALQKLTTGSRSEDIDVARAQVTQAKAEVNRQQRLLEQLTITATTDGILDALPYQQGERVPAGAVVAIIESNALPYARVFIPEPHKYKIRAGTQVNVHIDGVENPMQGTVRWVSVDPAFTPYQNMTEQDRSRLVYLSEITLPEEAMSLVSGIPLQVDLSLNQTSTSHATTSNASKTNSDEGQ